jgi:hypothetical protein
MLLEASCLKNGLSNRTRCRTFLSGANASRAQTLKRQCASMGSLTATSDTTTGLERIKEVSQMYTWAHFVRASNQLRLTSTAAIASSGQSVDTSTGFSSQQTVAERQDPATILETDGTSTSTASASNLSHQLSESHGPDGRSKISDMW